MSRFGRPFDNTDCGSGLGIGEDNGTSGDVEGGGNGASFAEADLEKKSTREPARPELADGDLDKRSSCA